jgi:sensor domain CHASE-containing protein
VIRILTFLWGVAVLVAALLAAYVVALACAAGFALIVALVYVAGELGVDFTIDRPQ